MLDAQGSTMTAASLGPLWAALVDSSGRARAHHLLDEQAFVAPGLLSDLLSLSGMAEAGWNFTSPTTARTHGRRDGTDGTAPSSAATTGTSNYA